MMAAACGSVRQRAAACTVKRRRRSSGLVSQYDNNLSEDHLFSVLCRHAHAPKIVECFSMVRAPKIVECFFYGVGMIRACPTHTNKHIIWDTKCHFCRLRIRGSLAPKNGQNARRNADTQHAEMEIWDTLICTRTLSNLFAKRIVIPFC